MKLNFPLLPILASLLCAASHAAAQPDQKPNIIVILADDVGWGDTGCYGATKIRTPHLDRLAAGGLRFTNSYAPASVCTPTRYALLTGQYPWRRDAIGLNKGVANGDSPILIPPGSATLPGLLQKAGYRTGAVGKWHLGFGNSKPDYNNELKPGPLEVGFDEFFGLPATNDRIPTVFVRDHRVVGLDPADPIRYSYDNAPEAHAGMTRMAAGGQRIGWMSGGKAAFWKDTEIADTFTEEATAFIARNKSRPFFLYFSPHNVHAPTIPHPRFLNTSGLGKRADMLLELDWSVGELMQRLEAHGLTDKTVVVFSSDNGAYKTDEQGHRPNGPWRGEKSQLWEGGIRGPLLVRWPGRIAPGVSDALVGLIDLTATMAAIAGETLAPDAAPDSFSLLPLLLGKAPAGVRDHLILMSGKGDRAIRQGQWKYIPDLATADGWKAAGKVDPGTPAKPGLYDLAVDPGEKNNLHAAHPEISARLANQLQQAQSAKSTRPL